MHINWEISISNLISWALLLIVGCQVFIHMRKDVDYLLEWRTSEMKWKETLISTLETIKISIERAVEFRRTTEHRLNDIERRKS